MARITTSSTHHCDPDPTAHAAIRQCLEKTDQSGRGIRIGRSGGQRLDVVAASLPAGSPMKPSTTSWKLQANARCSSQEGPDTNPMLLAASLMIERYRVL
jgi:hypothetical protein